MECCIEVLKNDSGNVIPMNIDEASKNRMAHSSEITRSRFFQIINSTPRDSWVMEKISYKIVRKKI